MKLPAKGTLTKAGLKYLMENSRWDIIGLYFNFTPKFLVLPVSKTVVFDWCSCPDEMSELLRQKTKKKSGLHKSTLDGKPVRQRLFDLQQGICFYCKQLTKYENWTIDHKIPRCLGGGNGTNLVGACYPCNNRKGKMTDTEFLVSLTIDPSN